MTKVLDERDVDLDLLLQLYGEYLDLPGMRLTAEQAARLLGTDLDSVRLVLDELVGLAFLCRQEELYLRVDSR